MTSLRRKVLLVFTLQSMMVASLFLAVFISRNTETKSIQNRKIASDPSNPFNEETASTQKKILRLLQSQFENQLPIDLNALRYAILKYRFSGDLHQMPLTHGPFVSLLIGQKLKSTADEKGLYEKAYNAAYEEQYARLVKTPDIEAVFDLLLQGIVTHALPASLHSIESKIGDALARKALEGKSNDCKLNTRTDTLDKNEPSTVTMAWTKLAAVTGIKKIDTCITRQRLFRSAKSKLIAALNDSKIKDSLKSALDEHFPVLFREQFFREINQRNESLGSLINQKFKGSPDGHDIFSDSTPLIENTGDTFSMKTFAQSIAVDVLAAHYLEPSENAEARSLAAGLFFGAANKLLVLTGGTEADWDFQKKEFKIAPGSESPPSVKTPKAAPDLVTNAFGGWSFVVSNTATTPHNWNWATYNPDSSDSKNSTPVQLFPSRFQLEGRAQLSQKSGEPVSQTLEDLAELLNASALFLKLTLPGMPLAKHLGKAGTEDQLLSPESPILFPNEGRLLAYGLAAGIIRNLLVPRYGHLELINTGYGVRFYERVEEKGRTPDAAKINSVARLLLAANRLKKIIETDPDCPAALKENLPQISKALQAGVLTLTAQGQLANGHFLRTLEEKNTTAFSLENWAVGMRVLSEDYAISHVFIEKLKLDAGWRAFESFRSSESGVFCTTTEMNSDRTCIQPSRSWIQGDLNYLRQ